MAFAITTFFAVLVFAVIPGLLVMIAGFLIGVVASLPILAISALTRLVNTDQTTGEAE